jgi:hypothetical protein
MMAIVELQFTYERLKSSEIALLRQQKRSISAYAQSAGPVLLSADRT